MHIVAFFFYSRYSEDFEILHGDLLGLSDTMSFLKSLAELEALCDSGKNAEKRHMRERIAAAGLFNWEVLYNLIKNSMHFLIQYWLITIHSELWVQQNCIICFYIVLQKVNASKAH